MHNAWIGGRARCRHDNALQPATPLRMRRRLQSSRLRGPTEGIKRTIENSSDSVWLQYMLKLVELIVVVVRKLRRNIAFRINQKSFSRFLLLTIIFWYVYAWDKRLLLNKMKLTVTVRILKHYNTIRSQAITLPVNVQYQQVATFSGETRPTSASKIRAPIYLRIPSEIFTDRAL